MKRISIVGLCLAAVFAFSAGAASSASAAPLLLLAQPRGGGSIAGVTFLSETTLAPQLSTHGGHLIDCTHATNFGKFLSSTLGDVLIRFLNCKSLNPELECQTAGAGKGEIHLPLATTVFHLGLAHLTITEGRIPAIVILLEKDVLINCGNGLATILVLGSVIGALKLDTGNHGPIPLNAPFSTALLDFEQIAHGLQHLRLFLFEHELRTYDLDALITEAIGGTKPLELAAEDTIVLLSHFLLPSGKENEIELIEH
ncbi:MAG TPA: hypothetical protein VNY27_03525 [Solirubrobacteraceae bacterium]|jgi:hypothetical protein|nr:hypothetical protein [Solirubrobacteraceae bacterium]